ncbi:unnamed protein product [Strongylus vulgaris]|uniref:Uncharacterized protein n=1 Tax=Strongylus vulgaris TaxID=40348 RepID=A0A3P7KBI9_STRVU|nr:unnamed protein product [Strongylus vulgaris]
MTHATSETENSICCVWSCDEILESVCNGGLLARRYHSVARMSVQRQLREDWDNREYEQIVADNVKNIANFLSSFELSCRSKLASLSDKLNLLEKKVEFLEARVRSFSVLHAFSMGVLPYTVNYFSTYHKRGYTELECPQLAKRYTKAQAPCVVSLLSSPSARRKLVNLFFKFIKIYSFRQRMTPKFWWDFGMHDMPLGVFRSVLKQQFVKNAHITDFRVIDRLVEETRQFNESFHARLRHRFQHMYAIRYAFYNPDHVRNYLFRENVEAKPKDFLSKFLSGQD